VPRFLDFELDEQEKSSLLQAWMCSDHPDSSPVEHQAARSGSGHLYSCLVGFSCVATNIETPVAIENVANLTFGGVLNYYQEFYGLATANVTGAFVCPDDIRPVTLLSEPEAESGFIENERVITFRPSPPDVRRPHQLTNLSLSPDAVRFAANARGRRLRMEEDPELQSE
jgi:hypothetical protein